MKVESVSRISLQTLPEPLAPVAHSALGYLLDWDGCVAVSNQLVPAAVRFMQADPTRIVIVSNNSSNTVGDFLSILDGVGLCLDPAQIILAGVETLRRAAEDKTRPTLVLSDPRMRAEARRLGVLLGPGRPERVVLLRDTRFSYARLEKAADAIARGAPLLVANPDTSHPSKDGRRKPETGAWLAAIRACTGIPDARVEIIGKPEPALFQRGCAALGLSPSEVMMIGDNPSTDIRGAENLGIRSLLVDKDPGLFFSALNRELRIA